jgi:opacity protein-like surface antigen
MIRRFAALAALAVLAAPLPVASPLVAQVPRLPVFNSGVPRGILVAADVGFPNDAAGGGETYALTGALGLGSLGFTGTLGSTTPTGGSAAGVYGGTANLRIIGGPLVPFFVNLQGGVGYADLNGAKTTHVPVGVGVGLTIPLPVFGLKPWFAPRWDYTSISVTGGGSNSTSAFAYSAGLDIAFIFGLGLRTAYDWTDTGAQKPSSWSIGAKWSFGV